MKLASDRAAREIIARDRLRIIEIVRVRGTIRYNVLDRRRRPRTLAIRAGAYEAAR